MEKRPHQWYKRQELSMLYHLRYQNKWTKYTEANYRKRYDITINTHGDALPYYNCHFSKNNSLTQCHFPTAKYHIDSQDEQYLKETRVDIMVPRTLI
jgi:hypothetical protein